MDWRKQHFLRVKEEKLKIFSAILANLVVHRRNAILFSFNPQMHKQQRPQLLTNYNADEGPQGWKKHHWHKGSYVPVLTDTADTLFIQFPNFS